MIEALNPLDMTFKNNPSITNVIECIQTITDLFAQVINYIYQLLYILAK